MAANGRRDIAPVAVEGVSVLSFLGSGTHAAYAAGLVRRFA